MKVFLLGIFSIALSIAGYAYSEGGKNRNPHMMVGEDGCVYTLPGNQENCDEVPAPPQSGIEVYVCNNVAVICADEEPAPPRGESKD